jgi:hypothetical protein
MTQELKDIATTELLQELQSRCSALVVLRVEDKVPGLGMAGDRFQVSGLLHAAILLNEREMMQQFSQSPRLAIANPINVPNVQIKGGQR